MSTDNQAQGKFVAHIAHHFKTANQQYTSAKEGIWLFMLTEILMFGSIFVGFFYYHNQYPEMFAEGAKSLDWRMGFFNTLVLIFSSFTMAISISFVQKNEHKKAVMALATTLLCGAIFMVVKYFEYTHKFHLGLYPGKFLDAKAVGAQFDNLGLYFGFYYTMTGLHGIHVLLGMGMITWTLFKVKAGKLHSQNWVFAEGVGLFWHVIDLIWIFLFPLLYLVG